MKDIQTLVIEDMEERKKVGMERYGKYLYAHSPKDGLRELQEELMDALVYLKHLQLNLPRVDKLREAPINYGE